MLRSRSWRMVLASRVCALRKVGFDGWQLMPCGGVIVIGGIGVLPRPLVHSFDGTSGAIFFVAVDGLRCQYCSRLTLGLPVWRSRSPSHDPSGELSDPTIAAEGIATSGVSPSEGHVLSMTPTRIAIFKQVILNPSLRSRVNSVKDVLCCGLVSRSFALLRMTCVCGRKSAVGSWSVGSIGTADTGSAR